MDRYSTSRVAGRTGFPTSTLRFYEQSGRGVALDITGPADAQPVIDALVGASV